jgi:hypothetical protein
MGLMHNDLVKLNCIVDNNKFAELADWEMAGSLG